MREILVSRDRWELIVNTNLYYKENLPSHVVETTLCPMPRLCCVLGPHTGIVHAHSATTTATARVIDAWLVSPWGSRGHRRRMRPMTGWRFANSRLRINRTVVKSRRVVLVRHAHRDRRKCHRLNAFLYVLCLLTATGRLGIRVTRIASNPR